MAQFWWLLSIFTILVSSQNVFGFATVKYQAVPVRPTDSRLRMSSREEEIAKLEAQLAKLRDETSFETNKVAQEEIEETMIALEKVKGKNMLLSEAEILDMAELQDGTQSKGISIPTIVGGLALAIGLLLFSQIPVGQEDLTKFQGAPSINKIDLGDLNPDIVRE